jgi:hypothetical protein
VPYLDLDILAQATQPFVSPDAMDRAYALLLMLGTVITLLTKLMAEVRNGEGTILKIIAATGAAVRGLPIPGGEKSKPSGESNDPQGPKE